MNTLKYLVVVSVVLVVCAFGAPSRADDRGRQPGLSYSDRDERPANQSHAADSSRPEKGNSFQRDESRPKPGLKVDASGSLQVISLLSIGVALFC